MAQGARAGAISSRCHNHVRLAYCNAGLCSGGEWSVLVVQAQPWQQAENGESQLVLRVPKQGSKAVEGTALPLCLLQYADAGDVVHACAPT